MVSILILSISIVVLGLGYIGMTLRSMARFSKANKQKEKDLRVYAASLRNRNIVLQDLLNETRRELRQLKQGSYRGEEVSVEDTHTIPSYLPETRPGIRPFIELPEPSEYWE